MSKLEVDKIDPQSGTDLELGTSGDTITIPTGVTLDASNATTTLPANVVTTDGTQTLTNKTIAAGSNTVTGLTNSNLSGSAAISNANLANSSITINDTAVSLGGSTSISTGGMYKNIIINGDMSIAQRGTSFTGLSNGDSQYTLDRFKFQEAGAPTYQFTMSQDTDVPSGQGFAKSLKMDCTTAQGSLAAADGVRIEQRFEGQNLQYLKKGTSNAESLTLSFWVKSNKTGTYIAEIFDNDNSRQISKSYTIDSASTWEKKTITYAGDTSGSLDNNNSHSLDVRLWLGAGSNFTSGTLNTSWNSVTAANRVVGQVNLADSTANEWYITGVQLEAGTTASDFEFLPYDVNLQRCQRYYYTLLPLNSNNKYFLTGYYYSTGYIYCNTLFPTIMRASPSLEQVGGTNYFSFYSAASGDTFDDFTNTQTLNPNSAFFGNATDVSGTAGNAGAVYCINNAAYVAFNSEL